MRRLAILAALGVALVGCDNGVEGRAFESSGAAGVEQVCTDAGDRIYSPAESWRPIVVPGGCR